MLRFYLWSFAASAKLCFFMEVSWVLKLSLHWIFLSWIYLSLTQILFMKAATTLNAATYIPFILCCCSFICFALLFYMVLLGPILFILIIFMPLRECCNTLGLDVPHYSLYTITKLFSLLCFHILFIIYYDHFDH